MPQPWSPAGRRLFRAHCRRLGNGKDAATTLQVARPGYARSRGCCWGSWRHSARPLAGSLRKYTSARTQELFPLPASPKVRTWRKSTESGFRTRKFAPDSVKHSQTHWHNQMERPKPKRPNSETHHFSMNESEEDAILNCTKIHVISPCA